MGRPRGRYEKRRGTAARLARAAASLGMALLLLPVSGRAKATTYVITDGERVMTCTSYATDPAQVLGEAGVSLREADTFTTEATEEGRTITVSRARNVTVFYHGSEQTASVQGGTVGELLTRRGLAVTGEDRLSHGMEEEVADGMVVRVDRITTAREVYSTVLPRETRYQADEALPLGEEKVLEEGRDGELLSTAEVIYCNGREQSREILLQAQIQTAMPRVIARGTAPREERPAQPEIGDGYIKLPTGELLTYTRKDTVRATAYTHTDSGCDRVTATGTIVHRGTVAVDPRYIPYGTRLFIMASDGSYVYGIAAAEDCGGDIKGDRMDLYLPTYEECMQFGRRRCTIYFLG